MNNHSLFRWLSDERFTHPRHVPSQYQPAIAEVLTLLSYAGQRFLTDDQLTVLEGMGYSTASGKSYMCPNPSDVPSEWGEF